MLVQIEDPIKRVLIDTSTDEQVAIAQILLAQIDLNSRYVSLQTLEWATPAVKKIEAYFQNSNDETRLGLATTILSAIFTSLVGQPQQESPTSEFQKNFLMKMLSDKASNLLASIPSKGTEAEVQLLDNFLRGVWAEWRSSTVDVSCFRSNDVFWRFVLQHNIGTGAERDRLFDYLRETV
jgi:hypothetical protein